MDKKENQSMNMKKKTRPQKKKYISVKPAKNGINLKLKQPKNALFAVRFFVQNVTKYSTRHFQIM